MDSNDLTPQDLWDQVQAHLPLTSLASNLAVNHRWRAKSMDALRARAVGSVAIVCRLYRDDEQPVTVTGFPQTYVPFVLQSIDDDDTCVFRCARENAYFLTGPLDELDEVSATLTVVANRDPFTWVSTGVLSTYFRPAARLLKQTFLANMGVEHWYELVDYAHDEWPEWFVECSAECRAHLPHDGELSCRITSDGNSWKHCRFYMKQAKIPWDVVVREIGENTWMREPEPPIMDWLSGSSVKKCSATAAAPGPRPSC
jgi:hypothetical protein